jgi:hypothetical protein
MVREIRRVALLTAGDNEDNEQLVETICMILEFDDAYRYRLQDGFGENRPGILGFLKTRIKPFFRETQMTKKKPASVKLGSLGGKATAKKRSAEERKVQAQKAGAARWARGKS